MNNILVFAGSHDIFHNYIGNKKGDIKQYNRYLYRTKYNKIIKLYKCIFNLDCIKGYDNVNIVFLKGWDWNNRKQKIEEISLLLSRGSEIIEKTEYIDPEILFIFNKHKKIEYTKFTRFEIMDI